MSKKKYISPMQLQLLNSDEGYSPSTVTEYDAPIDPFLPGEGGDIVLPDGGSVITDGSDVVIAPATPEENGFSEDVAYF